MPLNRPLIFIFGRTPQDSSHSFGILFRGRHCSPDIVPSPAGARSIILLIPITVHLFYGVIDHSLRLLSDHRSLDSPPRMYFFLLLSLPSFSFYLVQLHRFFESPSRGKYYVFSCFLHTAWKERKSITNSTS